MESNWEKKMQLICLSHLGLLSKKLHDHYAKVGSKAIEESK